ncbi:MAG: DegV family protein [Chloroflexota bacterium]
MSKVVLVTDSTAYIPPELVNKYKIKVIPQILIWGDKTYLDGVDISPEEFYNRLEKADIMPSSSQATPAHFKDTFSELLDSGKEILAVLISTALSGTVASALQAKEFFPDAPIEIVDSRSCAMALGFIVLAAARAAEKGASLLECKAAAEKAIDHTGVVFAVDTLEFLHRGGRIGGASRLLGTALNIKPILELRDGRVEPLEKVRTRKKALQRLLELVEENTKNQSPIHIATLHANDPDTAEFLQKEIKTRISADEYIFSEVSPVVGTHTGPGTIGIAYMVGI